MSLDSFSRHLQSEFRITAASGEKLPLRLIEAQTTTANHARTPAAPDAANEKFMLTFAGSGDARLEQGTYLFEHAALGAVSIFIVPMRAAEELRVQHYAAVFNRAPIAAG